MDVRLDNKELCEALKAYVREHHSLDLRTYSLDKEQRIHGGDRVAFDFAIITGIPIYPTEPDDEEQGPDDRPELIGWAGDEDEPDTAVRLHGAISHARALDITDLHCISVPVGEMAEVLDELMELRKKTGGANGL